MSLENKLTSAHPDLDRLTSFLVEGAEALRKKSKCLAEQAFEGVVLEDPAIPIVNIVQSPLPDEQE